NQVILPLSGSSNFWLILQADSFGSVFESNKLNNFSAAVPVNFTLTPPDLVPLDLAVAGGTAIVSATANPRITVNWAVTNQGNGLAFPAWYDRVWFSTNGMQDTLSVDLGDFYSYQTLAPGASYRTTNQVTVPMTSSASFWLFLQADSLQSVFES